MLFGVLLRTTDPIGGSTFFIRRIAIIRWMAFERNNLFTLSFNN